MLINQAKFLCGLEDKVKDLQKELKRIEDTLRDADTKGKHNRVVGECVAQLRENAYDAEDIIEQSILNIALKKGQNIIKAYACFMAKCACVRAHVVGIGINGLKSSISNLRTSMQDYGVQALNEGERKSARASMLKRTDAHTEEKDFVRREDSVQVLVKELLKDQEQQRAIFIWGMGGLGKTTLAKKVFTHDKVQNHFNCFAGACISQEYYVRDILERILVMLIPNCREGAMKMRIDELLETLYMTQQQKRCVVVLDDIWTKQAWNDLQPAFQSST